MVARCVSGIRRPVQLCAVCLLCSGVYLCSRALFPTAPRPIVVRVRSGQASTLTDVHDREMGFCELGFELDVPPGSVSGKYVALENTSIDWQLLDEGVVVRKGTISSDVLGNPSYWAAEYHGWTVGEFSPKDHVWGLRVTVKYLPPHVERLQPRFKVSLHGLEADRRLQGAIWMLALGGIAVVMGGVLLVWSRSSQRRNAGGTVSGSTGPAI